MNNKFDFTLEPGKKIIKREYENKERPLITVVMPYYNDKQYIEQSVKCVLNQTFPLFELLIIDDGSTDEESLKKLEEIKTMDNRIKIHHKKNEGLSATRDYGASKSSESAKYLFFLDSDDLIEETYFECAYWTLETNPEASWAYGDLIGFEDREYTWNILFDSEKLKKENYLVATAMIRKKDFNEVKGYELKEKAINEDWNFWLKMISKEKFPVKMNYYTFWYRRKASGGELAKANKNKKRTKEIVSKTIKSINKKVNAIQYPKYDYNWETIEDYKQEIIQIKERKNNKINLLYIIPWMVMGGADQFNIDFINGLNKDKFDITIISTEPANNVCRQKFQNCTIYDLTTFLDMKNWIQFINYIIEKKNINIIMNSNSEIGYSYLPYLKQKYPKIPIIDYVHMEEWYYRNGGYSRDSSTVSAVIDLTMTCNGGSTAILEKHFKRNKNEVKTVYIGVDEEKFNPKNYNQKELREKYEIPNDKFIVSYICRIANQKRPLLLMEIIKKYVEINKDVLFLIVGDGPMLWQIKKKAEEYKLKNNIKFMGRFTETQIIYAMSDATINCSIKEGLALTSYESLSMNVPVISSDVGGQKELINEEVGVIVDCIQEEKDINNYNYSAEEVNLYVKGLEKVQKRLNEYQKKCRKRILSGFTINHMINNMNTILEEIHLNPNQEKIKNGIELQKYHDLVTELIVKEYTQISSKYQYLCIEYKKTFGYVEDKFEDFKIRMWNHKWYRGLVKFLKKIGVFGIIKKIAGK